MVVSYLDKFEVVSNQYIQGWWEIYRMTFGASSLPWLLRSKSKKYLAVVGFRHLGEGVIDLNVAAKFTDRDIAILAYKLLGGA